MAGDTNTTEAFCYLCGESSHKVGKIAVAEGRIDGICRGCIERCRETFKRADYLPIDIRQAREADTDSVMDIDATVDTHLSTTMHRREVLDEIVLGRVYLLCRKDTGAACGYIMFEQKSSSHLYISGFAVHPSARGRGVGAQALKYVIDHFGRLARVDLLTHPENVRAIGLYVSMGFVAEGILPRPLALGAGPRVLMRYAGPRP